MNVPEPDAIVDTPIHQGEGWSIREVICTAGPESRPFAEQHTGFTIAAVTSGTFTYRGTKGRSLLHPGALLFGSHGACFECGHEHGSGDRCIAVNISPGFFEEIASAASPQRILDFPLNMLPVSPAVLRITSRLAAIPHLREKEGMEDLVLVLVMSAMRLCTEGQHSRGIKAAVEWKIMQAVRQIEASAHETLSLQKLAEGVGLSRSHFLRQFHRITAMTPYQFVLHMRLRRAALQLEISKKPVTTIAFDQGFGDLSTFVAQFKRCFGLSPAHYRRKVTNSSCCD
jgi:AraC family transcriptional regulator